MRIHRVPVAVVATGLLLTGLATAPAQGTVPVAQATVTALLAAWDDTMATWTLDGGTYDERCTDARFTSPKTHHRILLDPTSKAYRERTAEHGLLPTITVVRQRQRADRTVTEVRKALRRHHVRPVPAWTGTTLNPNAAARQLDRVSHPGRSIVSPAAYRWTALSATPSGGGTSFTGAYELWTEGAAAPYFTGTLEAVADAQQRLTSWQEVSQYAGFFGDPPTDYTCTRTWQWARPSIEHQHANRSLRKVARSEARLRNEVAILADTVNRHVAENGPVTVTWLQRRFDNRRTSPIRNGLLFTRQAQGYTLAWKVVLHHSVASYRVVPT